MSSVEHEKISNKDANEHAKLNETIIAKYIQQMSEFERQGYEIAKQHLESSFNIEKSIGFLKWKQKQEQQES